MRSAVSSQRQNTQQRRQGTTRENRIACVVVVVVVAVVAESNFLTAHTKAGRRRQAVIISASESPSSAVGVAALDQRTFARSNGQCIGGRTHACVHVHISVTARQLRAVDTRKYAYINNAIGRPERRVL